MRPSDARPSCSFQQQRQGALSAKGVVGGDRSVEFRLPRARPARCRARRGQPGDAQDVGDHARDQLGPADDARRGVREDLVALVGEELVDPNVFTSLPFDHIVSPVAVGRPRRDAHRCREPDAVTLELGGKSPALVTRNYPIADAAKRITHAVDQRRPDLRLARYALVPRERVDAFVAGVRHAFAALYADKTVGNADYTAIVNDRHSAAFARCSTMPSGKARASNHARPGRDATADRCAADRHRRHARHALMNEELFGPILPIVPYDTVEEATAYINAGRGRWRCIASVTTAPSSTSCCAAPTRAASPSTTGAGRSSTRCAVRRHRQLRMGSTTVSKAFANCRTRRRCSSASASSRSACSTRRTAMSCSGWSCASSSSRRRRVRSTSAPAGAGTDGRPRSQYRDLMSADEFDYVVVGGGSAAASSPRD